MKAYGLTAAVLFGLWVVAACPNAFADVEEIYILRYQDHTAGAAGPPESYPFAFEVQVFGSDMTTVTVEDPSGAVHTLDNRGGGEWGMQDHFQTLAELQAVYSPGDYVFGFDSADTVTINYAPSPPGGIATITYPGHQQADVQFNPVYTWAPAQELGDVLHLNVTCNGETEYEELILDTSVTSWQPGPVERGASCQFELSVATVQGGEPQPTHTTQGDAFTYYGVWALGNCVWFDTVDYDITRIVSDRVRFNPESSGGDWPPTPFAAQIIVQGEGLTGVSVTTPDHSTHALSEMEPGTWVLWEGYATVDDMNLAYGPGDYVFTFNGGIDGIAVTYGVEPPAGFATVTHPGHGQDGVGVNPVYTWEPAGGLGDSLHLVVLSEAVVYEEVPVNITQTSWQPGPLDYGAAYQLCVSVANIQGGAPIATQTEQGDDCEFVGTWEYANLVPFATASFDVDGITISRIEDVWECRAEIAVEGTGLTGVEVTTPSGHQLNLWGPEGNRWSTSQLFGTVQDMEGMFGPGDYHFVFNGGEGTATIGYNVNAPAGTPQITYPTAGQEDVEWDPVYQWTPADGLGDALRLRVHQWDSVIYEEVPADISRTSWQPGQLDRDATYSFTLGVMNMQDGGPGVMQTDNGDPFEYFGSHEMWNNVWFMTREELDIWGISIVQRKDSTNGAAWQMPYAIEIGVDGRGILSLAVEDPHGAVHELTEVYDNWQGDDPVILMQGYAWQLEERFATHQELMDAWGPGEYAFTINEGEDRVTIDYQPVEPAGTPDITYPVHGQHDVELDPAYAWTSAAGMGDSLALWVFEHPGTWASEYDSLLDADIAATSCHLWPLQASSTYQFMVAVRNAQDGGYVGMQTEGGLAFEFYGAFDYANRAGFDTGIMDPPDIAAVTISQIKEYENGAVWEWEPYGVRIAVEGTNVFNAWVTTPSGLNRWLVHETQHGAYEAWDWFDSAEDMETVYGPGDYLFTFNNGAATVTITYDVGPPAAPVGITYPGRWEAEVDLNPVYTWESAGGLGHALRLLVDEQDNLVYHAFPVDVAQTSWQPGGLATSTEYELTVSIVNLQGGAPQAMQTDQGDAFEYAGLYEFGNQVLFTTRPELALFDISIYQMKDHADGLPYPVPYAMEIEVVGEGIVSATVRDPHGGLHKLEREGDGGPGTPGDPEIQEGPGLMSAWWELEEEFETLEALEAVWGTGGYTFTFNNGEDTVTIVYEVSEPLGFANITYPTHGQYEVELELTCTWDPPGPVGDFLAMWIVRDPHGDDWDYDEQSNVPISETSWTPQPLQDDTEYQFELSVVNLQANCPLQLVTDGGRGFTFSGLFECCNVVAFDTGGAEPLDVAAIMIDQVRDCLDGSPLPNPYCMELEIQGTGIHNVTVEDPHGGLHHLVREGYNWWYLEDYGYADLASLEEVYGPGSYTFVFNDGADTVTVSYNVAEPSGFASIIYPVQGQQNVPPTPTFAWSSAEGLGDGLAMWVYMPSADEDVYEAVGVDITETSWQPGPLEPYADYEFELSVVNLHGGAPQDMQTASGDEFVYYGCFAQANIVNFTTALLPDIHRIEIIKEAEQFGGPEPGYEYAIEIWLAGSGIESATVEGPDTTVRVLNYWGDGEWGIQLQFAALDDLNAAFPPGSYTFNFNAGADSVTLAYGPSAPGGFANVTYPADQEVNVGANPVYQWEPAVGMGDVLALELTEDPEGIDETKYEARPVDIDTTSWQPGPLLPGTDYELAVALVNLEGDGPQNVQTDQGDDFEYLGVFVNQREIVFQTAPMPDLGGINIWHVRCYEDGVEKQPNPWEVEIDVYGNEITSVSIVAPNGTPYEPSNWGDEWELQRKFATRDDMTAAFGTGDYRFILNGGFDSVTITYNVGEPGGFADITNPAHNEHGVDLNPTLGWDSAVGLGEILGMWVLEAPDGIDEDLYRNAPADISTVSWQPGALKDQTQYAFELSVLNVQPGDPLMYTENQDAFTYLGQYEYYNTIRFDTVHRRLDGDANDDCKVNIIDMIVVRNKINQDPKSGDNWWADVNADGKINILDMIYVRNHLNERCE